MKKILITGSCGFIFSNFVRQYLKHSKYELIGVDKIIAPNNYLNIIPEQEEHKLYIGDIADVHFMDMVFKKERPDIILHAAAESFVDDSIRRALPFVHSNVLGTQVMVDMALKYGTERFVYISTDEVYGQLINAQASSWYEDTPINPRNPYSASKAAGELIVKAAHETHGLNYNITRCCNNFGPRQIPRNLVPKVITCATAEERIPIHGEGKQFREWIYVEDKCSAVMKIIEKAPLNEIYNIGSGVELSNLDMAYTICDILNKKRTLVKFVKDRPGHDFRYSVNCDKIKQLGWKPKYTFDKGIKKCIDWYLNNSWYFTVNSESNVWTA